jgi:hypothetical protein
MATLTIGQRRRIRLEMYATRRTNPTFERRADDVRIGGGADAVEVPFGAQWSEQPPPTQEFRCTRSVSTTSPSATAP